MNLYVVYNGYQGYTAVYIEVIACTEERANELASEQFKKDGTSGFIPHAESYWTDLEVEFKYRLADGYEEYVSEVLD
jgi:hypothetical protein